MAITGIDTIDGKQIIAAGAVSAKSAEMAYNDENGNPITGYLTAIPDTYLQNTDLTITDGKVSEISGVPLSAGSTPTYSYTDNNFISAIDASGLYAASAGTADSAKRILTNGTMGDTISYYDGNNQMVLNPYKKTPFGTTSGIYGPLQYATGAVITYGSSGNSGSQYSGVQYFGGFFKGNEWYISNATAGQALRGETHASRGVHISGATTAGYGFNLGILSVSGVNSNGSWKYGHTEDAALRAVSSCDMHESAFGYDANDKISGYNGSAFAGGSDVPEGVMVESGLEYNAVNEISGYNGSAIAQYGAEKQWLQHDDTIVHVANSAQYAFGVNVSAVGELLGISGPILNQETFAGYWNGQPMYQQLIQMTFNSNSTSTAAIPAELYSSAVGNGRRWIDPSNSFIHYGSQEISLPISWMLGSDRRGSISIINNALHYRGVDNSNTGCTAYICVKYRKA